VEVRVLGPLEITSSDGTSIAIPGTKMRGLVAMLALESGRVVLPERISDALWGDDGGGRPLNTLQQVVSKLRRVLAESGEPDRIVTRPSGYLLDIDDQAVDAQRFEQLVGRARDQMTSDPEAASRTLADALALWRGPTLADVPDSEVMSSVRARLDELRATAMEDRVDAELARGRHQRLVPELEALVAQEPLRERRWGQLMLALYGAGRQADALRAFQRARDTLADQLGIEPGPELRRIEAAVLAQDATLVTPVAVEASSAPVGAGIRRRGNVRHPISACIGREADTARLIGLSARYRLVTLTGPGGVGKTRLATEVALSLTERTRDGVWWVELSPARDAGDVVAAIEQALGLEPATAAESSPSAAVTVTAALANREALLVLDNCEHLVDALGPIVEEVLGSCADLRVVATSREGLGIAGELLFAVRPLELAAAIELFEERIEAVGADVNDARGAAAVVQICERLDRLPLALELAAARARHLPLGDILARLDQHVDALGDGPRSASARQRNLRAVADWSYDLLDASERVVFERLAVFAGGATLAAARRVCAGHGVAETAVETTLDRLVDKSLVVADRGPSGTRYRMLQTLADYARDRLIARGAWEDIQRAHAAWVCELAGTVQQGAPTTGDTVAMVQDEDVAIRQAITWSLASDPVLALEISTRLCPFWFGTMRVSVGWELLSAALDAAGGGDPALRSAGLAWSVVFTTMMHDAATAQRLADEALAFERQLNDPARLGFLSFACALAAGYRSGTDAQGWLDQARAHLTAAGDVAALGHVDFAEGALRLVVGDLDGAATGLHAAAAAFREHQNHLGLILAVSRLGELAARRNDLEMFADTHAELLELGRAGRSAGVISGATARLAMARLEQGSLVEARVLAEEALALSDQGFMPVVTGYVKRTAGLVNLRSGHITEGRAQLQEAIDAFGRGTGNVGGGQAALCWVDLSTSYAGTDETDDAQQAAQEALQIARMAGDPWVLEQVEQHVSKLG
jgi:predicted ATPase/DNA-binding SARP family transcriptional activator